MKLIKNLLFLIFILVFIYLRITPILNQTVPYTYDQGRDFLKVQEIVKTKNIPFIGPTTGIQGVFHGAWWYYFLIPFYLIFNGWPQGFYLGLFTFNLVIILFFFFFIKKNYNFKTAIFFLGIVSVSEFFIKSSFYASNNTLAPIFVLLFIISLYKFFKTEKKFYIFLTGLFLGMILETELAFGLFIIPSFLTLYFIFQRFKNIFYLFIGLIFPSLPRILFELKNNFLQTKSFVNQIKNPVNSHPLEFFPHILERIKIFWQYWLSLFYKENFLLSILFLFLILFALILVKNKKRIKKTVFLFSINLLFLIFILSLFYRNNFFWGYYLDGIQGLMIFILLNAFYFIDEKKNLKLLTNLIIILIFIINLIVVKNSFLNKKSIPLIGLKADQKIIDYFIKNTNKDYFCLKIYTPPVIPYTYMYLLSYYADLGKIKYPKADFYKNKCFILIDKDEYQFRIDKWRDNNIPQSAKLEKIISFENGTKIEVWKEKH